MDSLVMELAVKKPNNATEKLFEAIQENDIEKFKWALGQADIDINYQQQETGSTPLHLCLGKNSFVNELMKHNPRLDIFDKDGFTALHIAAKYGFIEVMPLLVSHGADVNATVKQDELAVKKPNNATEKLFEAIQENDIEKFKWALGQADIDINYQQQETGSTPLHLCLGKSSFVNELMKHNPRLDIFDKDGFTALHIAAKYGFIEVMSLLVSHGADVNATVNKM